MDEEIWFILIIWVISILVGFKWNNVFFKGLAGFIGIFLGFVFLTGIYPWIGLVIIFSGLFLLYSGLFSGLGGKKK